MKSHVFLRLVFLLASGSLLAAEEVSLNLDFTGNPADWTVVSDGYSNPSFTPRLEITDRGKYDGKFLGILLGRPPVNGISYYMIQPKTRQENRAFMTLRNISLSMYGTNLPYRMGILLEDGAGRSHEFNLGTANFDGRKQITHTANRDFAGLVFKALVIYLDGSVTIGEHSVYFQNLTIRGGGKP